MWRSNVKAEDIRAKAEVTRQMMSNYCVPPSTTRSASVRSGDGVADLYTRMSDSDVDQDNGSGKEYDLVLGKI